MANNPPVQRWFMEGGALAPLLALLSDSHPVVVTKALLGLSALVRHYDPGLEVRGGHGGAHALWLLSIQKAAMAEEAMEVARPV